MSVGQVFIVMNCFKQWHWITEGNIFCPNLYLPNDHTHAHLPTAELLNATTIRIYFTTLDPFSHGSIHYIDVDANNPKNIIHFRKSPVLTKGEIGCFDDGGVVPSAILNFNQKKYLFYLGFQRTQTNPYMIFIGLACWDKEKNCFIRESKTPLLDRNYNEPFSRGAPTVTIDNDLLKMWYWSCKKWHNSNHDTHYINEIRHLTTDKINHWHSESKLCLSPNLKEEYSLGRPAVIKVDELYYMWYSIRSLKKPYHLGYAVSSDGILWERQDELVGIYPGTGHWDSKAVCYPNTLIYGEKIYLFYNGNNNGKTGIGWAWSTIK